MASYSDLPRELREKIYLAAWDEETVVFINVRNDRLFCFILNAFDQALNDDQACSLVVSENLKLPAWLLTSKTLFDEACADICHGLSISCLISNRTLHSW